MTLWRSSSRFPSEASYMLLVQPRGFFPTLIRWRMLTYVDVCWRMLTYVDVCCLYRPETRGGHVHGTSCSGRDFVILFWKKFRFATFHLIRKVSSKNCLVLSIKVLNLNFTKLRTVTCFDSLYGDGIEGDNKIFCRMSVMFSLRHVRLF